MPGGSRFLAGALAALGLLALWIGIASAAPTIESVSTAADYRSVTVVFSETVTGTGAGDLVELVDVSALTAGANLTGVDHIDDTLTLEFDGPVQPATASLAFAGTNATASTTGVPISNADWTTVQAALRAIDLPTAEVPIAPFLDADADGNARTIADLLPATTASSLDLPSQFVLTRNSVDGSFTATLDDSTPVLSEQLAAAVTLDDTYGINLRSQGDISVDVSLGGTIELSPAGAATTASLTIGIEAAGSPMLTGGVGVLEATVGSIIDLDVSIGFDLNPITDDTATVTTASVVLGDVTIPGLGSGGSDLSIPGTNLLTISWPTLPAEDIDGLRVETGVGVDTGWGVGGLQQLANIGLIDVLGAPGGVATWVSSAQSLGEFATSLPVVGESLGDATGIAETLGSVQNEIAAAVSIATGPFATLPTPSLSPTICADLSSSAVRAVEVEQAIANLNTAATPVTVDAVLAEINNVTVDGQPIIDSFTVFCEYLFSSITVDLAAGTIEADVSIPAVDFDFFMSDVPSVDLGYDGADLDGLAVGLNGGTWTGSATAEIDLTVGIKLASDADLLSHGLAVDLNNDGIDEDDVTAAYRIYVPANETFATSSISVTGTDLSGSAQLGFLDMEVTGDVSISPSVALTSLDPENGFADGKADLLELLYSATADLDRPNTVDQGLSLEVAGDDVDIHFVFSNSLIGTAANLDIAGDLSGLLPGGTVDFRTTAISGPGDVPGDTLAIGATFGDTLNLAEMTPTQVVELVAGLLDQIAASEAMSAGDERIPVIDVSVNEVAGLTSALSDIASEIRARVPASVTELEAFVNDALAANGMGAVTLAYDPAGPTGFAELTLTLDADVDAAASYPINFELPDSASSDVFNIAPIDGGARLDAAVQVDFQPVLGVSLTTTIPFTEALFVRDVDARFDFWLSGTAEGSVALGPIEASLSGDVSIGDADLANGGFTAALESGGSSTVPLSALIDGTATVSLTGSVPVNASLDLEVATLPGIDPIAGSISISGNVPGTITVSAPTLSFPDLKDYFAQFEPNLGSLATGAIETARFVARGSEEVGQLSMQIPVAGADVSDQFDQAAVILDDVADEIQLVVDAIDTGANDAVTELETSINGLFATTCTLCEVDVRWVPSTATAISEATGIEVLLTIRGETSVAASTSASFGLEPIVELDVDITSATATIGFTASIGLGVDINQGFYLFPGIDSDPNDGVGTLFELYADLDLASDINVNLAGVQASAPGSTISVSGGLNGGTAGGLKIEMPDQLLIADLVNRTRPLSEVFAPELDAVIAARIPVTVGVELVAGKPFNIVLPLEFDWTIEDTLRPNIQDATFVIKDATLDVEALAGIAADVLTEFDENYNPLGIDQVKEALDTEIPLIEQTVRQVIVAACDLQPIQGPECRAFIILSGISVLTADLNALSGAPLPLGSFQIYPAPAAGTSRYTPPGAAVPDPEPAPGDPPPAAPPTSDAGKLKTKFEDLTRGYVTLPILDDLPAVMGIALGGELATEVDIVRLEIPEDAPLILGKSFAIKKTLLDLDIAFLEGNLSVDINGGIGLIVSGGVGYSTRGITEGDFFDGIFLIDNRDIEVALGAELNATVDGRFAISVAGLDLASVKFRGSGGFSAKAGLDLFDESPVLVGRGGGDGRLYFDEIAIISDAYLSPIPAFPELSSLCIFQLQTVGDWYLSFSGKAKVLGITVFNETFSEGGELWNETITCTLRTRIARVEGRQLILHAGLYANDRFDGEGDVAEKFRVTKEGTNAKVEWLGSPDKDALLFPLSSFDTIVANMGAFDDELTVSDEITHPVLGLGGPGNDTMRGGGGDDDINGGPGIDDLDGGAGDDKLRGGRADDTLTGGAGDDNVDGGVGNDTISFANSFDDDIAADSGAIGETDTLDFSDTSDVLTGATFFGDATVSTVDSEVMYPSSDFEKIVGGSSGDTFRFKDQEPKGFLFDGGGGGDDVTFAAGVRNRTIGVDDSGTSGTDTMTVLGSGIADKFLLRGSTAALNQTATSGFVARLSSSSADRYNYNSTIEELTVNGRAGNDSFTVDDNATSTTIEGGEGADTVQVGQIYGAADCEPDGSVEAVCANSADLESVRGPGANVAAGDAFATAVITRGHLSNGVTSPLVINGGAQDDTITIFSNKATVEANGGLGNDAFVARGFILSASVTLNGEGGIDDFSYVLNSQINIDGGAGVDTFTIVGTEANDGFIIDTDPAGNPKVQLCKLHPITGIPDPAGDCAIDANTQSIEVYALLGLEGDDVFWIRSSTAAAQIQMAGGDHSDTFLIGDGTLAEIDGPLQALGDEAGNVPAIADPVILPGENDDPAFEPSVTGGTDRGDVLSIDASTDPADLAGEVTDGAIRGLGMADGPFVIGSDGDTTTIDEVLSYGELEFIDITLGAGDDDVTVTSTHIGNSVCDDDGCPLELLTGAGDDVVDVKSVSGETHIDTGADDDDVTVGNPAAGGDTLDQIDAALVVIGGAGVDSLDLDDTNDAETRLDVDPGLITEAGLDVAGVAHSEVEEVHVRLGDSDDVVNIRGTAADASTVTEIHGNNGDERFYVSSAANFALDTSTDHLGGNVDAVDGPLVLHGNGGTGNLLYISDREATAGDGAISYDGSTLSGLAPATITHDVSGAFGGGITVWTSELADTMSLTGSDLSTVAGTRTLTTFNTGDGGDDVTASLTAGVDGPTVINTEEGADTVDGSTSDLDLVVFGGLGGDMLTTGSGNDIVFGDLGRAATADGGTNTGGGGPGDITDGGTQPLDRLTSDPSGGGVDTIRTGAGQDVAIGGVGGDDIGGDADADVLIGGHLVAGGSDAGDLIDGGAGDDVIAGDNATFDESGGVIILTLLDVETTAQAAPAGSGGADTITGGADDDAIFGQQGDDDLSGNAGDDTIEGNGGEDTISGGADQDDLTGGGSALDGVIDGDRSWLDAGVGLADGNDTIDGDADADVILGDNGFIRRQTNADGSPKTLSDEFGAQNSDFDSIVIRDVLATQGLDPDGSFGADLLRGGDGADEIYGQLDTSRTTAGGNVINGDEIRGGDGADVLIGDIGAVSTVLEDGSRTQLVDDNTPFLSATIYAQGTLTRNVVLFLYEDSDNVDEGDGSDAAQFGAEGDDLIFGDAGDDVIHGGSGDDVANGGPGIDVIFGGDGNDALWGGADNDELFGGHDEDALDVAPRDFTTTTKGKNKITIGPDPDIWFEAAPTFDALAGLDVAYGGWNSDEMQADEKANGPKPGDRLVDWAGAYNRYLACSNGNGAGTFLRVAGPFMRDYFRDLAEGRGAVDAATPGTSGYRELGIVEIPDMSLNAGSVGGTDHVSCP